jgi:hypothetical protein
MLNSVLAETREKLAEEASGSEKTAAAATIPPPEVEKVAGQSVDELMKLADACDQLAANIHLVNDDRTPQEKLAEFSVVHAAMLKKAAESGDNNPNKAHQTQTSTSEADPPESVGTDSSGTGVGGSTAIPSEETNTPGESMDAGQSGAATPGHQSPKNTAPSEKPNQQDAATAMATNQEMMMADQPEDVLKQAATLSPTFQALLNGGEPHPKDVVIGLLEKAASSGIA